MIFSQVAFFFLNIESWALEAVSMVLVPDFVEDCKDDIQNQCFATQ